MKKIALIQTERKGTTQNMETIHRVLQQTTDAGLCLFGAGFLPEKIFFQYREDIYKVLSLQSEEIAQIQTWAKETKRGVGFGFYENDKGGIYSSYVVIDAEGNIIAHAKQRSPYWMAPFACADYRTGKCTETFWWQGHEYAIMFSEDYYEIAFIEDLLDFDDTVDGFICVVQNKTYEIAERTEIFQKESFVVAAEKTGVYKFGKLYDNGICVVKNV